MATIRSATPGVRHAHEQKPARAVVHCTVHARTRTPLPILVVEDSDEDYATLVRACNGMAALAALHRCKRADEALAYLRGQGPFTHPEKAPRPALILLDLNLPGTDGRQLLTEIKSDAQLRSIPVVIVTTSKHLRDVEWCYQHGANGYQLKDFDYAKFREELQMLVAYWLSVCVLPASAEGR